MPTNFHSTPKVDHLVRDPGGLRLYCRAAYQYFRPRSQHLLLLDPGVLNLIGDPNPVIGVGPGGVHDVQIFLWDIYKDFQKKLKDANENLKNNTGASKDHRRFQPES